MARGDVSRPGPGQNIRDYTDEQLFDQKDKHESRYPGVHEQMQREIDDRAKLWHGLIK